jgi:hypothetical protein
MPLLSIDESLFIDESFHRGFYYSTSNALSHAFLLLCTALPGVTNWMSTMGTVATILMVPPILLSFPFIRNRFYNLFYYSHLFLHVGIVFLWLHASSDLYYMMPAIGLYATDILLRVIARFSPHKVLRVLPSSGGLVRVDFDIRYSTVDAVLYLCFALCSPFTWRSFKPHKSAVRPVGSIYLYPPRFNSLTTCHVLAFNR